MARAMLNARCSASVVTAWLVTLALNAGGDGIVLRDLGELARSQRKISTHAGSITIHSLIASDRIITPASCPSRFKPKGLGANTASHTKMARTATMNQVTPTALT